MSRLISRLFVVPAVVLALAGCQHLRVQSAAKGSSSFEFVDPPDRTAATTQSGTREPSFRQSLIPARPQLPLAEPVYPPAALAAGTGPVTVGVRLTVDPAGRVAEVGWSPLCLSTPTAHSADFRAAVEAAVAQWRFRPAVIARFEHARGKTADGEYNCWRLAGRENTDETFDVSFTFTATGGVLPGAVTSL